MSDPKFIKKKVTTGDIEADADELSILVHYEVEAALLGEKNETITGEKKRDVKSLNENTNVAELARTVVEKCKLIHKSKLPLVEALVQQLKDHKVALDRSSALPTRKSQPIVPAAPTSPEDEEPTLSKLDYYVEQLYESLEAKLRGTAAILTLARNVDNLEELLSNNTLFGALSRLLREEGIRHVPLASNIVFTFFCVSNFSQFHGFLAENQVGGACMRIVEYQLEYHSKLCAEIAKKGKKAAELEKRLTQLMSLLPQLLSVCFHLLLNLAEDVAMERKMRKKNLVQSLVQVLDWESEELVLVALTFLKKLSIFKENIQELSQLQVVPKIVQYVPSSSEGLYTTSLLLLLNLSFHTDLQLQMVKNSLIPKLVSLLPSGDHQITILKILYHLSRDDKAKSQFTYTECIPILLQMLFETPMSQGVPKEIVALAVNLCGNERNAEAFIDGKTLSRLLTRVKRTEDPLLMKLLRVIAQHENCADAFMDGIAEIVGMVKGTQRQEFLVEGLGTLASLALPKYNWASLLEEYQLVPFLSQLLIPGNSSDDIVLEVVMLIGTVVQDSESAQLLTNSSLLPSLEDLLIQKQDDDEIVLQATYTFFRLLQHQESRGFLLNHTEIVKYLLHLLFDKNVEIRKMEYDKKSARVIIEKKFKAHNAKWCEAISSQDRSQDSSRFSATDFDYSSLYARDGEMRGEEDEPIPWNHVHYVEEDEEN